MPKSLPCVLRLWPVDDHEGAYRDGPFGDQGETKGCREDQCCQSLDTTGRRLYEQGFLVSPEVFRRVSLTPL